MPKQLSKEKRDETLACIADLEELGYSPVAMERALQLPFGIIKKWREGKALYSAERALFKLIRARPWILNVAEAQFTPEAVVGYQLQAKGQALIEAGKIITGETP